LSDKLPKPNYDKQFNTINNYDENKNYRSFNKAGNNINNKEEIESKDFSKGIHIKKPQKLAPLPNIPEEKLLKGNNSENLNENNKQHSSNTIINNSHSLNNIIAEKNANNNNSNSSNNLGSKSLSNNPVNNNKIILKKDNIYYADLNSQQKNDLRRILLRNNEINRRKGYVNNSNQINSSPIKDINRLLLLNINNKSVPKSNKIIKNKYYIQSPPYLGIVEKYHENINKLEYDRYNRYNNNNNNLLYKEGPENKKLPKIPRRLSPIKKELPNII
jgi:hypothetical protein